MNPPPSFGRPSSNPRATGRQFLPLTVWLCPETTTENEQADDGQQTRLCERHRGTIGLELARHLIAHCTQPQDLVVEAYTSNSAALAAAAHLGRRAVACVPHPPLANHIGAALRAQLPPEKLTGLGMRPCRPEHMNRALADHLDKVSLVIAAPPPFGPGLRRVGREQCPACLSDTLTAAELQLDGFLLGAWRLLHRGGHLAVITAARHEHGRLVDPAPQVIHHVRALGFRYSQHVIALRVPVRGDELVVQAGPEDLAQLRDGRSRALPPVVSVHADVCLFTKPLVGVPGRKGNA